MSDVKLRCLFAGEPDRELISGDDSGDMIETLELAIGKPSFAYMVVCDSGDEEAARALCARLVRLLATPNLSAALDKMGVPK